MTKLYFWGANSHGQSGTGTLTEQFETPTEIPLDVEITEIICGGGHTFLLTNSAVAYTCGWNNHCQLGVPSDAENILNFEIVKNFKPLAAGWDVSAGSTGDKIIFCGNNRHEQFGISSPTQRSLEVNANGVTGISFGLRHTIVQFKDKIRLFGKSKCFKSLQEKSKTLNGIEVVEMEISSRQIASGQHHFLIQTSTNDISCFGDNKFGQCGETSKIRHNKEILKIFTGWTHSGFLDVDGDVFMWGRNNYGQLGHETAEQFSKVPLKVAIPEKVLDVCSGSEHVAVRTEKGNIYCWGWNEHGNCGDGGTENVLNPKKVECSGSCKVLGAGAGFTFAFVEN